MNFDLDNSSFWLEPDVLLTDLVSYMANKMGAQLGVTLMIKGAFLTGTLVGENAYLAAISDLFQAMARDTLPATASADDLEAIIDAFDFETLAEDVYPEDIEVDKDDENDEEGGFDTPPLRYVHLQDPMIIYPGSTISFSESPLPIMRIRLNTIDGWMLGRISIMSDNDGDQEDLPKPPTRLH
ncbi:MAG: hypothetical protein SGI73_16095 [Chloroflexota bacterium]|nr:hypothetical protein [Chloroflexota bacterium]